MTTVLSSRLLWLAFALGTYGGAVLALSHLFFTPGKYLLLPYALVVVGLTIAIRAERLTRFAERFLVALLAFMLATLVLYVTVAIQVSTAVTWGHTWRLALLLVIGAAVSLPAAILARVPQHRHTA